MTDRSPGNGRGSKPGEERPAAPGRPGRGARQERGARAEGHPCQQAKVRVSHVGLVPDGETGGTARAGLARGMAAWGGGPPEE